LESVEEEEEEEEEEEKSGTINLIRARKQNRVKDFIRIVTPEPFQN
jgi:hypothetical protein